MKNLNEFANVIECLRTIINASGHSRFSRTRYLQLRDKLSKLELEFLELLLPVESKENNSTTKEPSATHVVIDEGKAIALDNSGSKTELSDPLYKASAELTGKASEVPMGDNTTSVNKLETEVPASLATEVKSEVKIFSSKSKKKKA